jgi:hypothetical protein
MTPDKKVIFFTETEGTTYRLRIIQLTGQTFATADLAGIWRDNILASSATVPAWDYDTLSITSAGVGTTLTTNSSSGNTTPDSPFTIDLSTTGVITTTGDVTVNGTMSFNKNMMVVTDTVDLGVFSLNILLK